MTIEGFECQAEELALSAVSSREPQEALEQGSNHKQSNWMCASYLQLACLFSTGPNLNSRGCQVSLQHLLHELGKS